MQVPEKLSLIGGSILLASTLVFTLKSQASNILPKVNSGISTLTKSDQERQQEDKQNQANQDFMQQAQQKGWQTGYWGSAPFYVDDQSTMHVGNGQLKGSYTNLLDYHKVKNINLDSKVQAPQDSSNLFGRNSTSDIPLARINGLANLDTSQATDMYSMFWNDNDLQNLDVSHFDTHNVTNMAYMFGNIHNINYLDVSHFDTSHVTSMKSMFYDDYGLSNLDVSHFDTHNVTNMGSMFWENEDLSNLDVSHFDTSHVTNMSSFIYGDWDLNSLDVSHFDTHNVTNMSNMFGTAPTLNSLDVSHFDTSNVTNMSYMFDDIGGAKIDLSHFNTRNVTNMDGMFEGNEYSNIDLSHLDTSNVQTMNGTFAVNASGDGTDKIFSNLSLGPNTKLLGASNTGLDGTYKNGNQTLDINQLANGQTHPGTWIKQ